MFMVRTFSLFDSETCSRRRTQNQHLSCIRYLFINGFILLLCMHFVSIFINYYIMFENVVF